MRSECWFCPPRQTQEVRYSLIISRGCGLTATVVIVNWNSGALLQECLNKVSRQTVMPQRIVVVDNASSDTSAACTALFPGVILLKMTSNFGFAGGNNRALALCDTEFVAVLNPDAFPEPDWLERLLAAARANLDFAAFGSRQLSESDGNVLDGVGDRYHMSGLVWRERYGARQSPDDLVEREIFSPCAAAALYRRQAVVEGGGFDEDFFCYVEDVDFGFRLRLAGQKAMYVPDAVVHHVGSATTGGQHSDFAVYHGHRNLVWTYVKNMPGWLFWVCLPLHFAMNLVAIIGFGWQGQGGVMLRAKRDALLGLPKMWRKRREIQRRRVASVADIWRLLDKRLFPRR